MSAPTPPVSLSTPATEGVTSISIMITSTSTSPSPVLVLVLVIVLVRCTIKSTSTSTITSTGTGTSKSTRTSTIITRAHPRRDSLRRASAHAAAPGSPPTIGRRWSGAPGRLIRLESAHVRL